MPTLTLKSLPLVLVFSSALSPASRYPQGDPRVVLTPTAQRPLSSAAISSTARYVGINLASLARVAGSERVHRKGRAACSSHACAGGPSDAHGCAALDRKRNGGYVPARSSPSPRTHRLRAAASGGAASAGALGAGRAGDLGAVVCANLHLLGAARPGQIWEASNLEGTSRTVI